MYLKIDKQFDQNITFDNNEQQNDDSNYSLKGNSS